LRNPFFFLLPYALVFAEDSERAEVSASAEGLGTLSKALIGVNKIGKSVCAPIAMEAKVAEGRQRSTSQAEGHVEGWAAKNYETGAAPGPHTPRDPADAKDADEASAERPGDTSDDQGIKSAQVRQRVLRDSVWGLCSGFRTFKARTARLHACKNEKKRKLCDAHVWSIRVRLLSADDGFRV
jgi:hypothetical protein